MTIEQWIAFFRPRLPYPDRCGQSVTVMHGGIPYRFTADRLSCGIWAWFCPQIPTV